MGHKMQNCLDGAIYRKIKHILRDRLGFTVRRVQGRSGTSFVFWKLRDSLAARFFPYNEEKCSRATLHTIVRLRKAE